MAVKLVDGVPEWLPQAEQSLCAGALYGGSSRHVQRLSQTLSGDDFYLRSCGQVWDAAAATRSPDLLSVADELDRRGQLEQVGGMRMMSRWISAWWIFCSEEAMSAHAALVKRDSERRKRLAELGKEAAAVGRGEISGGGVTVEFTE